MDANWLLISSIDFGFIQNDQIIFGIVFNFPAILDKISEYAYMVSLSLTSSTCQTEK